MVKYYNILGRAYADMIQKTTNKPMTQISEELGYEKSYMKHIIEKNRIRVGVANQIESVYGIPVSPYIIPEKKEEGEKKMDKLTTMAAEGLNVSSEEANGLLEEKKEVNIEDAKIGVAVAAYRLMYNKPQDSIGIALVGVFKNLGGSIKELKELTFVASLADSIDLKTVKESLNLG